MPGRGAEQGGSARTQAGPAGAEDLRGAIDPAQGERVRLHLRPVQPAALAMDAQAQAVFLPRGDLRRLEGAACPALEAEQRADIVIQSPAGDMRRQLGG